MIMYGVSDDSENQAKVKLYRNKNSDFVRVDSVETDNEYIYIIDEAELLKNSIFRYVFHDTSDTSVGLRYFRRGDRKENREYTIYRFHKSGNIIYREVIGLKENKDWILLKQYEYKPKTLSWVKVK